MIYNIEECSKVFKMDKSAELKRLIDGATNIVFFGGAGVSTLSGMKDFRGKNGLYKGNYDYPLEYFLSSNCFYHEPELFFKFYKENMNALDYKPNIIHEYLAKLEQGGKLQAIVTQNIDGLHQKAGSKKVYEIHGTIYKNHCIKCHKFYSAEYVFSSSLVPKCSCGGIIKPDVVLYGEMLPDDFDESCLAISKADLFIVAGTSLTVEPAASLVKLCNGNLVILNDTKTPYDFLATLVINEDLAAIFKKL